MTSSSSRRFPVTVTQLPVTRCEICQRTVAYRPGTLSEALTEHYRRAPPVALGPHPRESLAASRITSLVPTPAAPTLTPERPRTHSVATFGESPRAYPPF